MEQSRLTFAAAVIAASLAATPALSQSCFEDVGCPYDHAIPTTQLWDLSCDALWTVRNSIYKDNGYCFNTKKAISIWGNAGCLYDNAAEVPLNTYESGNVQRIRKVEQEKGCP